MDKEKLNQFLKNFSYHANYSFIESASDDMKLQKIINKWGLTYPSRDFSAFKCSFAYTDEENKNGMTLPDGEMTEQVLATLRGKAVNFDHYQREIVGYWLDAEKIGKTIYAYGMFFKSNLSDEYELIKKLMLEDNLKISMEAWGEREYTDLQNYNSYNLKGVEFAGGALLLKTNPAFPNAKVMVLSNDNKTKRMESLLTREVAMENFIMDNKPSHKSSITFMSKIIQLSKEVFTMEELIKSLKENANEAESKVLDQILADYQKVAVELEEAKGAIVAKETDLESAKEVIEKLKAESTETASKIEAMEKEITVQITQAKEEALKIAEIKSELGEFVNEFAEVDFLNVDKVEIARLKKQLANKIVAGATGDELNISNDLDIAKKKELEREDEITSIGKRVRELAYGKSE